MIKRDELANPKSCFNKAADNEMLFVLRGRDAAVPATIRAWVEERIRLGLNERTDEKLTEALYAAEWIERHYATKPEGTLPC